MLLTPHPTASIVRPRVLRTRLAERCPGESRGPSSATFLSIQKTLRAGSATAQLALHRAIPRGHTTRFFTIVHQHHPSGPQRTGGELGSFCRDV